MDNTITIIICDDDHFFCEKLNAMIKDIMSGTEYDLKTEKLYSGRELINYFKNNSADIVFTDIDMGDINGFKVSEKLRETIPELAVVFITSHEELALQAYDYIPFSFISKRKLENLEPVIKKLLRHIATLRRATRIVELVLDKSYKIDVTDIIFFKSEKHYVYCCSNSGTETKLRGSLSDVYSQIKDKGFIRVQQQYVVNCRYIKRLDSRYVTLTNEIKISVTRNSEMLNEAQCIYMEFRKELMR